MRWDRVLALFGLLSLAVAGFMLVTGTVIEAPWLTLASVIVGLAALVVGVIRGRKAPVSDQHADPVRSRARARAAVIALGAVGVAALVVAITVAQGEAREHAIGHLIFGIATLGLFAALAFPWQPRPGTSAALVRTGVMSLLAVATFGFFLESLGGAGYDAVNEAHRVEALTTLHRVAMPFAAIGLPGLPLGILVGVVVFVTWAVRRRSADRAV